MQEKEMEKRLEDLDQEISEFGSTMHDGKSFDTKTTIILYETLSIHSADSNHSPLYY